VEGKKEPWQLPHGIFFEVKNENKPQTNSFSDSKGEGNNLKEFLNLNEFIDPFWYYDRQSPTIN
jgi:hypothetical protein